MDKIYKYLPCVVFPLFEWELKFLVVEFANGCVSFNHIKSNPALKIYNIMSMVPRKELDHFISPFATAEHISQRKWQVMLLIYENLTECFFGEKKYQFLADGKNDVSITWLQG